jgi:hypothetical protein
LIQSLLSRVLKRTPKAKTILELRILVGERAAFAAQRTVIAYCEVKAGINRDNLFADAAFQEALALSRWETFAVVLADALLALESHLRPRLADRIDAFHDVLRTMYDDGLASQGIPNHRTDWADAVAAFRSRLDQTRLAGPRKPTDIAAASVKVVFETVPVHPEDRRYDGVAIRGGVLFNFLALWEAVMKGMDEDAIAAAIPAP